MFEKSKKCAMVLEMPKIKYVYIDVCMHRGVHNEVTWGKNKYLNQSNVIIHVACRSIIVSCHSTTPIDKVS